MLGRCGLELVVGSTIGCTLVPVEPWQDVSKYHLQLEPEIGDSFQVQCPSEGQEFGEGRLNWSWQAFCLELLVFFLGEEKFFQDTLCFVTSKTSDRGGAQFFHLYYLSAHPWDRGVNIHVSQVHPCWCTVFIQTAMLLVSIVMSYWHLWKEPGIKIYKRNKFSNSMKSISHSRDPW